MGASFRVEAKWPDPAILSSVTECDTASEALAALRRFRKAGVRNIRVFERKSGSEAVLALPKLERLAAAEQRVP